MQVNLATHRFDSRNFETIIPYIASIPEFDEIKAKMPVNEESCINKLALLLDNNEGLGVVVVDEDEQKIASIGILGTTQLWWSDEVVLNNWLVYTEPKYRSTRATTMVMDLFKGFAKESKLPFIFDVVSGEDTNWEIFRRYFELTGFKQAGISFLFK